MQQSSSFTGVDCLEVLERLEADDTNDEDDRPDTTDLHWKQNDLQTSKRPPCATPEMKFNELSDSHEIGWKCFKRAGFKYVMGKTLFMCHLFQVQMSNIRN